MKLSLTLISCDASGMSVDLKKKCSPVLFLQIHLLFM